MPVKEMRVGVYGLHYARVAEQRLHHLRELAALDQGRAERVAQAVEGEPLMVEAGVVQQRFVFSVVKVAVFYGVAGAVGEDEVVVLRISWRPVGTRALEVSQE
jgi:hypothetical protein